MIYSAITTAIIFSACFIMFPKYYCMTMLKFQTIISLDEFCLNVIGAALEKKKFVSTFLNKISKFIHLIHIDHSFFFSVFLLRLVLSLLQVICILISEEENI